MSQHHRRTSARPWQRLRRQVLERSGGWCEIRNPQVCTQVATEVDHIHPVSKGGTDHINNLRSACRNCNQARNRTTPTVDSGWTW